MPVTGPRALAPQGGLTGATGSGGFARGASVAWRADRTDQEVPVSTLVVLALSRRSARWDRADPHGARPHGGGPGHGPGGPPLGCHRRRGLRPYAVERGCRPSGCGGRPAWLPSRPGRAWAHGGGPRRPRRGSWPGARGWLRSQVSPVAVGAGPVGGWLRAAVLLRGGAARAASAGAGAGGAGRASRVLWAAGGGAASLAVVVHDRPAAPGAAARPHDRHDATSGAPPAHGRPGRAQRTGAGRQRPGGPVAPRQHDWASRGDRTHSAVPPRTSLAQSTMTSTTPGLHVTICPHPGTVSRPPSQ